jgi:hypothetical protein
MTLIYWHYPSVVQYMTMMIFIAHYYSGVFFLLFRLGDFFQFLCLVAFDFAFASFPTSLLFCLFAFPLLCFFCSFPAFTLVCFLLFRFYLSSPKATPKISESIRPKPTQNKLDTSLE